MTTRLAPPTQAGPLLDLFVAQYVMGWPVFSATPAPHAPTIYALDHPQGFVGEACFLDPIEGRVAYVRATDPEVFDRTWWFEPSTDMSDAGWALGHAADGELRFVLARGKTCTFDIQSSVSPKPFLTVEGVTTPHVIALGLARVFAPEVNG